VEPIILAGANESTLLDNQDAQQLAVLPAAPTDDPGWILVERVGNGYVGARGSLAEGSVLSAAATFVAGIFDSDQSSVPALTPTANWTRLSITVDRYPLRLDRGYNLAHRR
jgi:Glycosyl hydrolase family 65, N-terminal domain